MKMQKFVVTGKFLMGGTYQDFSKEIAGSSKSDITERILSEIGSHHKTKRRFIKIDKIEVIAEN